MKVEAIITERITDLLESGQIPWKKSWIAGIPKNAITGHEYRGINPFLLNSVGHSMPFFLTFNQIKSKGGRVLKGSKSLPVIFWKFIEKENSAGEIDKFPLLRYYRVFNIEQTADIDFSELIATVQPRENTNVIKSAQKIIDNMPNRPEIDHNEPQAYYRPSSDTVNMPNQSAFTSDQYYYNVLFHELTHSTGHKSRLDRKGVTELTGFGTHNYSKEELVAEFGAAMLSGHSGIENETIENNAAYIQNWLKALKNDKRLVVMAAAAAQKATDYILDRKFDKKVA